MTISDIMWETMSSHIKEMFKTVCNEYETNPKYKVLKIFEKGELKGFAVYHDFEGIRYIHEVHYTGKNKFAALKFWRWFKKDMNDIRCVVQKVNKQMLEWCLKLGFKIVSEDNTNYYLKRGD